MNSIESLVKALSKLPGIGEKSATRLALFLVKDQKGVALELSQSLIRAKEQIRFCRHCQNLTEEDVCHLCRDNRRLQNLLCVVEGPADLISIEKTGEYRGLYYLLHRVLSPMEGIGPDEMNLAPLIKRIKEGKFGEVIIATNPNPEGEATALYVKKALVNQGVRLTRITSGVPVGGTLEYTDAQTLARSLMTRHEF